MTQDADPYRHLLRRAFSDPSMGSERGDQLRSCDLGSVTEAVDAFEEDDGLLLCRIARKRASSWRGASSRLAPCFTVPEGFHALVQRGGADEDFGGVSATWPAGLHWGMPWLRVKYLVTKQSVVYHCNVKHCITRDNIPVVVRATVVLRVRGNADDGEDTNLVRKFAYGLGVRGLETQLTSAVEEGIRVMARATLHQAVYALTSGGGVIRRRPRPASPSPPPLKRTPTEHTEESAGMDRLNCSTIKRSQIAPSPHPSVIDTRTTFSSTSQAAPFVAGTVGAVGGDGAAATSSVVRAHPASALVDDAARTQPAPLPAIQRGLRASRIVPAEVADALTEALKISTPSGEASSERSVASSTIAAVLNNPARVHPAQDDLQGAGETRSHDGLRGSGGGVGGVLETPVRSRAPPAVTNLDLSPSRSLSDSSTLPKLELEIAQSLLVPSFPATTASLAGDLISVSGMQGGRCGGDTTASLAGDLISVSGMQGGRCGGDTEQEESTLGFGEGNAAARHGRGGDSDNLSGRVGAGVTTSDAGEGGESTSTNGGEGRTSASVAAVGGEAAAGAAGAAAAAAPAAAAEATAAVTQLENNIALGRRHAEQLRDRLNRTLSPQGVEITTVMIRSLELPPDIAEQMSGTTLHASLNEEQRAVKKSGVQRVKHEEEVLGVLQENEIKRALMSREGDEEVAKARLRLQRLHAQANAMVGAIRASASTTELRVASEAQREASRSCLREAAEHSLGQCSSSKVAGILDAEAAAFRTRRESEAHLEVACNSASARLLVNASEEKGTRMLRAARGHAMENKRLEVLNSLAANDLTLVTDSPLVTAAGISSVEARQSSDGLTAVLLGEAGFKAHILEASARPGSTRLPSSLSLAARRGRIELEAQLAFAAGRGGGAVTGAAFLSPSFAVHLNPWCSSPKTHSGGAKRCRDSRNISSGGGGIAAREPSEEFAGGVRKKRAGLPWQRKKRDDGKDGGRKGRGASGTAAAAADCELCILRDGMPNSLVCSV